MITSHESQPFRNDPQQNLKAELANLIRTEEVAADTAMFERIIAGDREATLAYIEESIHATRDVWQLYDEARWAAHNASLSVATATINGVESYQKALQRAEELGAVVSPLEAKYDEELGPEWERIVSFVYACFIAHNSNYTEIFEYVDGYTQKEASNSPLRLARRLERLYEASVSL